MVIGAGDSVDLVVDNQLASGCGGNEADRSKALTFSCASSSISINNNYNSSPLLFEQTIIINVI